MVKQLLMALALARLIVTDCFTSISALQRPWIYSCTVKITAQRSKYVAMYFGKQDTYAHPSPQRLEFFATTSAGLEKILAKEIKALPGVSAVVAGKSSVTFKGTVESGSMYMLQHRYQ